MHIKAIFSIDFDKLSIINPSLLCGFDCNLYDQIPFQLSSIIPCIVFLSNY